MNRVLGCRLRARSLFFGVLLHVVSRVGAVYWSVCFNQRLASARVSLGRSIHASLWFLNPVLRKVMPRTFSGS